MIEGSPARPSILVMGVSGSGKTTIGRALADRTGWPFIDADDLHSVESVAKMAAGTPLTDDDRWPWLQTVATKIAEFRGVGRPVIVGCSALKRTYRDLLRTGDPSLQIVYLQGSRAELVARLAHRHGHFFPAQLLEAQLADLEEPTPDEHPITVPIGPSPDETVEKILFALAR